MLFIYEKEQHPYLMPSPRYTASVIRANVTKPHIVSLKKNRRDWALRTEKLFTDITFRFLRLSRKNVSCKRLLFFFSLIEEPQVHFPPTLIFQEALIFEIPLAVFLPQVVRLLCKRLSLNTRYFKIKIFFFLSNISKSTCLAETVDKARSPDGVQNKSHQMCSLW